MDEQLSRRGFLAAAAAGALVGAGMQTEAEAAGGLPDIPIIDPHQHLWDLKKFHLPWLSGQPTINSTHLIPEYRKATAGMKIEKTIYMEVDMDPKQQVQEAEWVIKMCENPRTKMAGGTISGRPDSGNFETYISRFNGNPYIKGVRQILHPPDRPRGLCLRPQFVKSIQYLGEIGMRYDICIRPDELIDGAKLIDQCPKTRFVLDHCGNAELQWPRNSEARRKWEHGINEIAKRKHVICKISGIIKTCPAGVNKAHALQPYVNHCLEAFGPNRVVFASDWPVVTLAAGGSTLHDWASALWWIVRDESAEFKRKLFHDNAKRFYDV